MEFCCKLFKASFRSESCAQKIIANIFKVLEYVIHHH